MLVIAIVWISL